MELTKALRIAQNPCWFQFAADLLAKMALSEAGPDRNGVLAAVRRNGFKLEFAPEELKKDRQIILAAVKHNGAALQFAAEELKKDRQIVCAAVKQNGAALRIDNMAISIDINSGRKEGGSVFFDSQIHLCPPPPQFLTSPSTTLDFPFQRPEKLQIHQIHPWIVGTLG